MNPKEKAEELVDKFLPLVESYSSDGQTDNAKQAAMIAVHEILRMNVNSTFIFDNEDKYTWTTFYAYWSEVLIEISKL